MVLMPYLACPTVMRMISIIGLVFCEKESLPSGNHYAIQCTFTSKMEWTSLESIQ